MNIRISRTSDLDEILSVYEQAFGKDECPPIQKLVTEFLEIPDEDASILSLVAENESLITAHVIFSAMRCQGYNRNTFILAPLAVSPDHQRAGIGSALVKEGISQLTKKSSSTFFVYGDPAYYERFGFTPANPNTWVPPYPLEYPHGWQILLDQPERDLPVKVSLSCLSPLNRAELW